jgi:hypothetical protein
MLSRCRLHLVLLGVAPFRSAPLGVLRPKPLWGRARSPSGFFFLLLHGAVAFIHSYPSAVLKPVAYELLCRQYPLLSSLMHRSQLQLRPFRVPVEVPAFSSGRPVQGVNQVPSPRTTPSRTSETSDGPLFRQPPTNRGPPVSASAALAAVANSANLTDSAPFGLTPTAC